MVWSTVVAAAVKRTTSTGAPMSLDKAIAHGKERRKPYRKGAAFSAGCRHGGNCDWCRRNRTLGNKRRQPADLKTQLHNGADAEGQ
jgi:hypothetical protein